MNRIEYGINPSHNFILFKFGRPLGIQSECIHEGGGGGGGNLCNLLKIQFKRTQEFTNFDRKEFLLDSTKFCNEPNKYLEFIRIFITK